MNSVQLMGRLTADPEMRQTQSGNVTVRFTIAINRPVKQGQQPTADFIPCVAWNKTAEFLNKYFGKGDMIALNGTIRTGSYQDKKYPEVRHFTTEIWVEKLHFCGGKNGQQNNAANTAQNAPYTQANTQGYNYSANAAQTPQRANTAGISGGYMPNDFEEIIPESDLPF